MISPQGPENSAQATARGSDSPGGAAPVAAVAAPSTDEPDRTLLLRQIVPVVLVAALLWLLVALAPVLEPFAAAAILAYICNPLVERLEARRIPRAVGSVLTTTLLVLAFLGFLLVVVPLFIEQSARLADRLPVLLRYLAERGLPWLHDRLGDTIPLDLGSLSDLARQHAESLRGAAAKVFVALSQRGAAIAGLVGLLLLVPVVTCYLLIDWPRITFATTALAPRRWQARIAEIAGEIDHVLGQFLRGQLSVMLVLAAFYSIALAIAGIEYALALGLITGLLCFIPYLGFGLGLTLALLSAFLQNDGWMPFVWVGAIFGAGQLIESFFLTPRLVGERIGLHPVVVILALLVFGQLLGFLGVVIALPVSAVLLVALRHALAAYRDSEFFRRP
jgi:predicted PurR-regulated permease PerM